MDSNSKAANPLDKSTDVVIESLFGSVDIILPKSIPESTWKPIEVIKRDGTKQPLDLIQIRDRMVELCEMEPKLTGLNIEDIVTQISQSLVSNIRTSTIDNFLADEAHKRTTVHPDYDILATRLFISNLHKTIKHSWLESLMMLPDTRICPKFKELAIKHADVLQKALKPNRDYLMAYNCAKVFVAGYINTVADDSGARIPVELPCYRYMTIALYLFRDDIASVLEYYDWASRGIVCPPSPLMFCAGTVRAQPSSCFVLYVGDDLSDYAGSISSQVKTCMDISGRGGGIGLCMTELRAAGDIISRSGLPTDGPISFLPVFDAAAISVTQGQKRKSAFAVYMAIWHRDIEDFIRSRLPSSPDGKRFPRLHNGLWIPDLFWKRVLKGELWSLFSPKDTPLLLNAYGDEFENAYIKYEKDPLIKRVTINAYELIKLVAQCNIEKGEPYILNSCQANKKNALSQVGPIYLSNLCTEIMLPNRHDRIAVCNLHTICAPTLVSIDPITGKKKFDEDICIKAVDICTRACNKMIDLCHYTSAEAKASNMEMRPLGIGVQGLSDLFLDLDLVFDSPEARKLNKLLYETIYYGFCRSSCDLARIEGPYPLFAGSPASKGILQYHMWGLDESMLSRPDDWRRLVEDIKTYGLRNGTGTAQPPTASTSQLKGVTESMEPPSGFDYMRKTLNGMIHVVDTRLLRELIQAGLWNSDLYNKFRANKGSLQGLTEIPEFIRRKFRTAREIPQASLIEMSADRGPFIDQSQSLSLHFVQKEDGTTLEKLIRAWLYGWKLGLKTSQYYCRVKPVAESVSLGLKTEKRKTDDKGEIIKRARSEVTVSTPVVPITTSTSMTPVESTRTKSNPSISERVCKRRNAPTRETVVDDNGCDYCQG